MSAYMRRVRWRSCMNCWNEKTRRESPFREDNLTHVQQVCMDYCKKRGGKCVTEVDLWNCVASVTIDCKSSNPMSDWNFLDLLVRQVSFIIPQDTRGFYRVCFLVKYFW